MSFCFWLLHHLTVVGYRIATYNWVSYLMRVQ